MTGLYQDTVQGAKQTAIEIAKCKPDTVRIYPTVIMKHTYLGQLYESGNYHTLSVEETGDLSSELRAFVEQEHSFVKVKKIEHFIHPKDYSKAVGQKKSNLQFFTSMGYLINIKTNETIQRNRFLLAYAVNEQKGVEVCG